MLRGVQFVTERELVRLMHKQLEAIIQVAKSSGIPASSVIVVPASTLGNSSREIHARLQSDQAVRDLGVTFFDGNALQLQARVTQLGDAVIVFVDDFAGTGKQFVEAHKSWSAALTSLNPASYFLACVMCSQAVDRIKNAGVNPAPAVEHRPADMFKEYCHGACGLKGATALQSYASEIHSKWPLGFENMGCLVVIYRNAPNNVPFLLRGTQGQRVWFGLFPRKDQLQPKL